MKLYRLYNPFGFGVKKKKRQEEIENLPKEPTLKYPFRYPKLSGLKPQIMEVVTNPEGFWATLVADRAENKQTASVRELLYDVVTVVAAIGALLWFVIEGLVGELGLYVFVEGIRFAVYYIALSVAGVYVAAHVLKEILQRRFGVQMSLESVVSLVTFSSIPFLVCHAFPALPLVGTAPRLFSLYSLYILFTGCTEFFKGQDTKVIIGAMVTVVGVLCGCRGILLGFAPY